MVKNRNKWAITKYIGWNNMFLTTPLTTRKDKVTDVSMKIFVDIIHFLMS